MVKTLEEMTISQNNIANKKKGWGWGEKLAEERKCKHKIDKKLFKNLSLETLSQTPLSKIS